MSGTLPRIAVYVPHGAVPDTWGYAPAIVAFNFARRLQAVSPVVISALGSYCEQYAEQEGIPIHRIREGRVYRRLFRKITRLDPYPLHARAARILEQNEVDLFHAHQLEFPVANFRARLTRPIPVIVHTHGSTRPFDASLGIPEAYVAPSRWVLDKLRSAGYPEDRLQVVPNGVDTDLFAPADAHERAVLRQRYGLPADAAVVTFVGRKVEEKGFHVFLDVAERLAPQHHTVCFLSVGRDTDDAPKDRSYTRREQVRARLRALPNYFDRPGITHAELADIFRISDITLLPSRLEPQGLTMIESMASGCVTISSNLGGICESIVRDVTGYLLDDPADVEEAVRLVDRTLRRLPGLGDLRQAARERVVAHYDWRVVTALLEQIYLRHIAAN